VEGQEVLEEGVSETANKEGVLGGFVETKSLVEATADALKMQELNSPESIGLE
jgi:hypothetical protein